MEPLGTLAPWTHGPLDFWTFRTMDPQTLRPSVPLGHWTHDRSLTTIGLIDPRTFGPFDPSAVDPWAVYPLDLLASGPVGPWSFEPWGPSIPCALRTLDLCIPAPFDLCILLPVDHFAHFAPWTHGLLDHRTPGPLDLWTFRHSESWALGPPVRWTP